MSTHILIYFHVYAIMHTHTHPVSVSICNRLASANMCVCVCRVCLLAVLVVGQPRGPGW